MSVHGCGQAVAVEGGGGHCVSVCLSVCRSIAVQVRHAEKSATMRITVVDIDLTHGRAADVLSTNSLSTGRAADSRMNA